MNRRLACVFGLVSLALAKDPISPLPSDERVMAALDGAVTAWGINPAGRIRVVFEPLDACNVKETHQLAQEHYQDTVTTFTPVDEDGKPIEGEKPQVISGERENTIVLNSSCRWTDGLLNAVVLHELGHVLMGPRHSDDRTSIMFPLVSGTPGKQTIKPEDRRKVVTK